MRSSCIPAILLCLCLSACTSPRLEREARDRVVGLSYRPTNIHAAEALPPHIHRVAMLPLHAGRFDDAPLDEISANVVDELRRSGRFAPVEISREEMFRLLGVHTLSTQQPIPAELLEWLRRTYQVQAVFQADLTAYRPYQPLQIGWRMRLFEIGPSRLLWAADELFDAGNSNVVAGARRFSQKQVNQDYPLHDSRSSLISPSRFTRYAAFTLFETLPAFELKE